MQEGPPKRERDTAPKHRVFPLFVPVLWFLGGPAAWQELTAERAALANILGFVLTALLLGIAGVAVIAAL